MITPVFEISQTEENLIFNIRAPYANLKDLEIEYTDQLFLFSCSPYYLRVHLSHNVKENEGNNTSYDVDSGVFKVTVPKLVSGQFFEDLDMISKLLRPNIKPSAKQLVEEVPSYEDEDLDKEDYYQNQEPQNIEASIRDEESSQYGYGFGWRRTGVLEQLREQIGSLVEVSPESVPLVSRLKACIEFDQKHFDYQRYLLDNLQPEDDLNEILRNKFNGSTELTENDREKLKNLPNRKLPSLSASDEKSTFYLLVDLVFCWTYDQRVNNWEKSCESGWNIVHLSPSLSFLLRYDNLFQACSGVIRRSLCYPLYRNWNLALAVLQDTMEILKKGKTALVHVLSDVHSIMIASSEFRYIFNDLIITNLLLWLQNVSNVSLASLSDELANIKILKEDMELDLNEIELNGRVLLMTIDSENVDSDDET